MPYSDILLEKLSRLARCVRANGHINVLLFSWRPEFFSFKTLMHKKFGNIKIDCFSTEAEIFSLERNYDLALICNHVATEHFIHNIIRQKCISPLIVSWTWDNHHSLEANLRTTALADIVLPGHAFRQDGLHLAQNVIGRHTPLSTGQWSSSLTTDRVDRTPAQNRSSRLYGGYVNWSIGSRLEILIRLRKELPDIAIDIIEPQNRNSYFERSNEERFDEWAAHKVHLVLSVDKDVSCRLFDSLISGQVPLVVRDCPDLDSVVDPKIQESLPIIRYEDNSTACIKAAWAEGLRRFDESGEQGVLRRHQFARDNHHAEVRIVQIVDYLVSVGQAGTLDLIVDHKGVHRTITV